MFVNIVYGDCEWTIGATAARSPLGMTVLYGIDKSRGIIIACNEQIVEHFI